MITSIRVKNLALVDDINIDFENGLNILTGETGAGKSVLMNSIALCLGEKANKSLISNGKDYALVEVSFTITKELQKIKAMLDDLGLTYEIENDSLSLFISRKIGDKNVCRVNGEQVNIKTLQALSSLLVDTHAQHETSMLLNSSKHINILDQYAGFNASNPLYQECEKAFHKWKEKREECNKAQIDKKNATRDYSLAVYEIEEIQNANLKIDEDKKIEEKYKTMKNNESLFIVLNKVRGILNDDGAVNEMAGLLSKELHSIANTNENINSMYNRAIELEELYKDFSFDIENLINESQFSDEEFAATEERLDLINNLKSKYGNSIQEILDYCNTRQEYVDRMDNFEAYFEKIQNEEKQLREELIKIYNKVTELRVNAAKIFEKNVEEAMHGLNFNNAQFRVAIDKSPISPHGRDSVEFMAILNKGTIEQPLANVASGGELSRVMLAIKSIMAEKDNIETLIFDEIDSGISGNTAWLVGERLYKTSIGKQILCITHLPQIAAFADHHYIINKQEVDDKVNTTISQLSQDDSLNELKRLSGVSNTNAINELKEKANSLKK